MRNHLTTENSFWIPSIEKFKIMQELISQIHNCEKKIALAITGGGTEAVAELLKYGGGSATVVDVSIPYANASLQGYLNSDPDKYCSPETACLMAAAAFDKCRKLTGQKDVFGFGATSSLMKNQERDGREHWVHIASCTQNRTQSFSFQLNGPDRLTEEKHTTNLILECIAYQLLDNFLPVNLLKGIQRKSSKAWYTDLPYAEFDWKFHNFYEKNKYIMPGSFNPVHNKHFDMANYVWKTKNEKVAIEISMENVDKPSIDHITAEDRITKIFSYRPEAIDRIYVTRSPLFIEKARIFQNSTFLVGGDTLNRIFNVKYYESQAKFETAINELKEYQTKFLVFPRLGYELNIPSVFEDACELVSPDYFTDDGISSSQIRKERKECLSL